MYTVSKLIAAVVAVALVASSAFADTLDDIIAEGKIVVGVKADYAPWGMRDAAGNVVGMEIDMVETLPNASAGKPAKPSRWRKSWWSPPTACSFWSRAKSI